MSPPSPGSTVTINGLVNASELNGRSGTVLPYQGSPERLPVSLGEESVLVRPKNLLASPTTPATSGVARTRPVFPTTTLPLVQQASDPKLAEELRSRGWAVMPLAAAEAKVVRAAGDAAARALADLPAGEQEQEKEQEQELRHLEQKRILSVRPKPLHTLLALLQGSAHALLGGVAAALELPADFIEPLLDLDGDGEPPETTLSAMRYHRGAEGGCVEHVDRGLLTLVTGRVEGLEVYDRVQRRWVAPPRPAGCDESVVVMAGATLFRATAGLVPASRADEIGPLRHRVQPSGAGERQSLVLRIRARPAGVFVCAPLRGRAGAVARFVDGTETVAAYIAAQHFTSVNLEPAAATAAADADWAVAEAVFDEGCRRCAGSGLLCDPALDQMTDVVAAAAGADRTATLLGQLQGLYMAEWLAEQQQPSGTSDGGAAVRRRQLRTPAEDALGALLRRRSDLRPASDETYALLGQQIGDDAAHLMREHAAARSLQAATRGRLSRKAHGPFPWSYINLKTVTQDGNEIYYKCRRRTQLGRLMRAFCNREGVSMSSIRFLFDGNRINEMQTPIQLEMEDGDVLDVMVEQRGD